VGKLIELSGKIFGHLTVIRFDHYDRRRVAHWLCKCDCGNECVVDGHSLRRGHTKSCGKANHKSNMYYTENGYICCELINTGRFCKVDKEDYEKIKNMVWYEDNGYAKATVDGHHIRMHRLIMDTPSDMFVDHINHDTLDNRKANLRNVTPAQNAMNTRPRSNNRGVSWCKITKKWHAQISVGGKTISLGRFSDMSEAIKKRKEAEEKYYGEFRYTN
jgi:hypothetical protein